MSWVALLDPVGEPDLGHSGVLVGHLEVACTVVARVLQTSGHFQAAEAGNPSLDAGDFHNENIV